VQRELLLSEYHYPCVHGYVLGRVVVNVNMDHRILPLSTIPLAALTCKAVGLLNYIPLAFLLFGDYIG